MPGSLAPGQAIRRGRARRVSGQRRLASEVQTQIPAAVSAAGGPGPRGGGAVRRVGREIDVREKILRHVAYHLPDRRSREDRESVREGKAEGSRRAGAGGPQVSPRVVMAALLAAGGATARGGRRGPGHPLPGEPAP